MNIALWIVQLVLGIAFLGSGGMKVFAYRKYKESVGANSTFRGGWSRSSALAN